MVLGDNLPEQQKLEIIRRQLTVGRVLKLYCKFTKPPKEKYLVVTNIQPYPILFLINSEINAFIKARPHLLQCQVQIDAASHSLLDHHSYIDCTEAKHFTMLEMESQIVEDMGRLKDCLSNDLIKAMISAVERSVTLDRKEKRWILASLNSL
jgi:hypothetical protein